MHFCIHRRAILIDPATACMIQLFISSVKQCCAGRHGGGASRLPRRQCIHAGSLAAPGIATSCSIADRHGACMCSNLAQMCTQNTVYGVAAASCSTADQHVACMCSNLAQVCTQNPVSGSCLLPGQPTGLHVYGIAAASCSTADQHVACMCDNLAQICMQNSVSGSCLMPGQPVGSPV